MPSLWKKHGGSRISRLVADLQTPPKRCGSLVVETGFPTSLVDLFVKNRDKLKKPKSKKKTAVAEDDVDEHPKFPTLPSVSGSSASNSEFDSSSCSNVENSPENDAQFDKNGIFDEEFVEINHDDCRIGNNVEEKGFFEVSNSNIVLSILMGLVVFLVAFYTKRWFLVLITLGFILLMLLEYVGKPCFGFLKPCEKVISMSILKGVLVVGVALYTKWFVVGITVGASLLLLLEYVGNVSCGFFKPCRVVTWKWQGILPHWGASKRRGFEVRCGRRGGREVLTRSLLIGSKRRIRKDGDDYGVSSIDFDQGRVGVEDESMKEVKPEFGCGLIPNRDHELASEGDRESVSSKGEIKQGSGQSIIVDENSVCLEGETENKPMYEMLDLELNHLESPRNGTSRSPVRNIDLLEEKGAIEGRGKGIEVAEVSDSVNYNVKCKRNKKFWKKLVPKKLHRKKKHIHERGHNAANADGIQESETDIEEDDGQKEREQEISEVDRSTSMSSLEENECEIADYDAANTFFTEMLELDNRTNKPCEMVRERAGNLEYLTTLMIPLTGLIGGRMFAVVLTVFCCLVFKIVRG